MENASSVMISTATVGGHKSALRASLVHINNGKRKFISGIYRSARRSQDRSAGELGTLK